MADTICTFDRKICIREGLICVSPDHLFQIIGNKHGNYNYVWHFLSFALSNGRYSIEYVSGAIEFYNGGWFGGNCIIYDGIISTIDGIDLPSGYEYLPGSLDTYASAAAAESANKGKTGIYTVTKGGISVCFKDTNATDNYGSITYEYTKLEEGNNA